VILFRLDTAAVSLVVFGVILEATVVGMALGRSMRHRSDRSGSRSG